MTMNVLLGPTVDIIDAVSHVKAVSILVSRKKLLFLRCIILQNKLRYSCSCDLVHNSIKDGIFKKNIRDWQQFTRLTEGKPV
jgi:hypothetical protein